MKKRILFLDFDGVVNTEMWDEKRRLRFNDVADGKVNNFQAVQWVSSFCKEYDFGIVVTSTWRDQPTWRDFLRNGGLWEEVEIVDKTEDLGKYHKREEEIRLFLDCHLEIEDFIVVDDDCNHFTQDLLRHCVEVCSRYGFDEEHWFICQRIFLSGESKKKWD